MSVSPTPPISALRRPKGYVGREHQTIGSDILAVLHILKLPEHVLGAQEAKKLLAVDPMGWYPIGWMLDLMEHLDEGLGHYGLVQMGRKLFDLSHRDRVIESAKSARDIVFGIDEMYRHANRGIGIGGWKVTKFEPGVAELEKTTPHHCAMEEGILLAALKAVGCPGLVTQSSCFRKGADSCLFVISSSLVDERWSGAPRV